MSSTGKSTALAELARRGHQVVDTDDPGWIVEVDTPDGPEPLWDLHRIGALVEQHRAGWLFVAGCVANQSVVYDRFDADVRPAPPAWGATAIDRRGGHGAVPRPGPSPQSSKAGGTTGTAAQPTRYAPQDHQPRSRHLGLSDLRADLAHCGFFTRSARPASPPTDGLAADFGDRPQVAANAKGNLGTRADGMEQIDQAGRRLPNSGEPRGELVHAGAEHDQRRSPRQGGRGGKDAAEACPGSGVGHHSGPSVVVADEILGFEPDRSADGVVGEVQNFEVVDGHLPDPAAHLEGVDADFEEVAKQLRPRSLLPVRAVPYSGTADHVVAALGDGGVGERHQAMPGCSLVPEGPADPPAVQPGDDPPKVAVQT